jgi:hypothetical protein
MITSTTRSLTGASAGHDRARVAGALRGVQFAAKVCRLREGSVHRSPTAACRGTWGALAAMGLRCFRFKRCLENERGSRVPPRSLLYNRLLVRINRFFRTKRVALPWYSGRQAGSPGRKPVDPWATRSPFGLAAGFLPHPLPPRAHRPGVLPGAALWASLRYCAACCEPRFGRRRPGSAEARRMVRYGAATHGAGAPRTARPIL